RRGRPRRAQAARGIARPRGLTDVTRRCACGGTGCRRALPRCATRRAGSAGQGSRRAEPSHAAGEHLSQDRAPAAGGPVTRRGPVPPVPKREVIVLARARRGPFCVPSSSAPECGARIDLQGGNAMAPSSSTRRALAIVAAFLMLTLFALPVLAQQKEEET